jgi:hypothetical protein
MIAEVADQFNIPKDTGAVTCIDRLIIYFLLDLQGSYFDLRGFSPHRDVS